MAQVTLYFAPGSCTLAALASLEAAGADFEAKPIRTASGEQRAPAYLAINPRGQVPALAVDGLVICENLAVLTWIATAFPEAGLLPADVFVRARTYEFLSWFATTLHVAVAQTWRGERFSDDPGLIAALRDSGPERMARALKTFEGWAAAAGEGWLFGPRFSVADPLSVVARRWAGRMDLAMNSFPALDGLADRAHAHPAVARALAREAQVV